MRLDLPSPFPARPPFPKPAFLKEADLCKSKMQPMGAGSYVWALHPGIPKRPH